MSAVYPMVSFAVFVVSAGTLNYLETYFKEFRLLKAIINFVAWSALIFIALYAGILAYNTNK